MYFTSGLTFLLAISLVSADGGNLTLSIISQNSSITTLRCLKTGETTGYITVVKDGQKLQDLPQEHEQLVFHINTPACGTTNTYICNYHNGKPYEDKITVYSSADEPIIRLFFNETIVTTNKAQTVICQINNMCSEEQLHIDLDYKYHIRKPGVSYEVRGGRFSATANTTIIFNEPGEHQITCYSESSPKSPHRFLVETMTAEKPQITITENQPPTVGEKIGIKCNISDMSHRELVIFDHDEGHFKKTEVTYKAHGSRYSATAQTSAIFTIAGEHKVTCRTVKSGQSTSITIAVKQSATAGEKASQTYKVVKDNSAIMTKQNWKVILGFALICLFYIIH